MSAEGGGFRGYISSRPVRETSFPQRVQNSIVRNYAARKGLQFKLSLTEYAMKGCYMMLESLLDELPKLNGIIIFSMFMLPASSHERRRVYARVLQSGSQLHAALEETTIASPEHVALFEDTLQVANVLRQAPLKGRFEKNGESYSRTDPFVSGILHALQSSI